MLKILKRPLPAIENIRLRLMIVAFHSVFVALFLMLVKPFEVYQTGSSFPLSKDWYAIGIGVIVMILLLISELLIWKLIRHFVDKWTVGHSIMLFFLEMILVIGTVFLYINYWSNFEQFNFHGLLTVGSLTIAIAILPAFLSTVLLENYWLRQNIEKASHIQTKVEKAVIKPVSKEILIPSDNNNEWLKLDPAQLLFVESVDNYVNVHFKDNGENKKQLLRSNLKKLELEIQNEAIVRCHRSYIVNLANIKSVDGNSRGLQLFFKDYDESVPVARSYVKGILERLEN